MGSRAARFRVDPGQVDAVRQMLGLELPVRVFVRRYRLYDGRYIGDQHGEHRIGIDPTLDPEKAQEALLHELFHCCQAERLGGADRFYEAWWNEMRKVGITPAKLRAAYTAGAEPDVYADCGLEVEAQDFAESFPAGSGLVRAVG